MRHPASHLGIALVLLAAVLGGYAYWFSMVETASSNAATLSQQIVDQGQSSAREQAASRMLASFAADQTFVRNSFITTEDVVPFLESLQTKGTSLGTNVAVGSVSADQKPQPHLTLSLSIQGSFNNVMRTLGAIEYLPYDIQVTTLTLAQGETGNASSTTWAANATITVGTRKDGPPTLAAQSHATTTAPAVATTTATTTP